MTSVLNIVHHGKSVYAILNVKRGYIENYADILDYDKFREFLRDNSFRYFLASYYDEDAYEDLLEEVETEYNIVDFCVEVIVIHQAHHDPVVAGICTPSLEKGEKAEGWREINRAMPERLTVKAARSIRAKALHERAEEEKKQRKEELNSILKDIYGNIHDAAKQGMDFIILNDFLSRSTIKKHYDEIEHILGRELGYFIEVVCDCERFDTILGPRPPSKEIKIIW